MPDSSLMPDKNVQPGYKRVFKKAFLLFESRPLVAILHTQVNSPAIEMEKEEQRKDAIVDSDTHLMPAQSEERPADISTAETIEHTSITPGADISTAETCEQVAVADVSAVETIEQPVVLNAPVKSQALPAPESSPNSAKEFTISPRPTVVSMSRGNKRTDTHTKRLKIINVVLLFCILMPLFTLLAEGVNAFILYNYAHDGMQHLLHVKDIFMVAKAHPGGFLDGNTLRQVQQDFLAARADFQQLKNELEQDPLVALSANVLPRQVTSAHALSQIGIDVSDIGQQSVHLLIALSPSLQGSVLADTKKPLVTPATMAFVRATIEYVLPRLQDVQLQAHGLSFDVLPVSADQKRQAIQLLQALPTLQDDLTQVHNLLDATGWILGVNEPRTLLVQTMDRAELRPTGGFTGQFAELQINAGRVAPFTLRNIGPFEENNPNSPTNGQLAPVAYRSWWPVPNWGLRDSNLSADFPTSARIAITAYKYEFHRQVDGVLLFSPFLIARVLQVTGPITIPAYHETITAQNLEERLHYYQLDNVAIRKEEIIEHVEDPVIARKLFTANLARLLMDHVHHASPDELIAIGHTMLHALHTKDLQVYVNNVQIEALLVKYNAAAQMDRSNRRDSIYVVQANVSASKASQYVRTVLHDVITLDAKGGATHVLQLRLIYSQVGPVYGLDTYRDYIRIYVPKSSTLLWGNGFDSGIPLCGGPYGPCVANDIYQNGALLCQPGGYEAGAATDMLNDPYTGRYRPLDTIGPPTNTSSDEPERAMFGGWVVIPKNCTMTVTLSWYVPPLRHTPYALLIQRQSSTFPEIDVTLLPTPQACNVLHTAGKHITTVLDGEDLLISLKPISTRIPGSNTCYPMQKM